jgi:hypothetical protein
MVRSIQGLGQVLRKARTQRGVAFSCTGVSPARACSHIGSLVVRGDVVPVAIALVPGSCLAGGIVSANVAGAIAVVVSGGGVVW